VGQPVERRSPLGCPPEPVRCPPEPIRRHSEPIRCHSEPIRCHPEPIRCHSEPIRCRPEPIRCHSERSEESRSAAQGRLREGSAFAVTRVAREQVAELIGAHSMDVIFTSCATEAIEVYSRQLTVKAFSIRTVSCQPWTVNSSPRATSSPRRSNILRCSATAWRWKSKAKIHHRAHRGHREQLPSLPPCSPCPLWWMALRVANGSPTCRLTARDWLFRFN
jgi:hypothetical protein